MECPASHSLQAKYGSDLAFQGCSMRPNWYWPASSQRSGRRGTLRSSAPHSNGRGKAMTTSSRHHKKTEQLSVGLPALKDSPALLYEALQGGPQSRPGDPSGPDTASFVGASSHQPLPRTAHPSTTAHGGVTQRYQPPHQLTCNLRGVLGRGSVTRRFPAPVGEQAAATLSVVLARR
jgi:hypothetical protein